MAPKRKPESLAMKALKCLREKELGVRHYKRSDALMAEILREIEPGQAIPIGEHDLAIIKDKMPTGTIQFFHGSYARRYELERVKA
jgi:hypothetical protein